MHTDNLCFCEEIRKISTKFGGGGEGGVGGKCLIWSSDRFLSRALNMYNW